MNTIIGTDIEFAKSLLQAGELVAIPTETVYGLAANALNTNAVIKIFETKNRPQFNPLIVHCADWQGVEKYVTNIPAKAIILAKQFSPGPITFLLDKKDIIPDLVTAGSKKVAIRIPSQPLALELLQQLSFPLAAPSANPFGYISPTSAQHVMDNLRGKIPYILDGGPSIVGVESTIIGFNEIGQVVIYRSGGISKEEIEYVIQEDTINVDSGILHKPITSGQLASHYAPETPLYSGDVKDLLIQWSGKKIAVISFSKNYAPADADVLSFILSAQGNLKEAAANLFATLRAVDQLKVDVILAEKFPDEGIGQAINDRLSRAGADKK